MADTTAALYIVLHTRPSPCLMVSQLRTTFGYLALCCKLSKVVVIAVTSRGTQLLCSLTFACRQGFTRCYLLWKNLDSNQNQCPLVLRCICASNYTILPGVARFNHPSRLTAGFRLLSAVRHMFSLVLEGQVVFIFSIALWLWR